MKLLIRTVLLCVLLFSLLGCRATPELESLVEDSRELLYQKDYQGAIEVYQKIVQFYPDSEEAEEAPLQIAQVYLWMKDYQNAAVQYEKIISTCHSR